MVINARGKNKATIKPTADAMPISMRFVDVSFIVVVSN